LIAGAAAATGDETAHLSRINLSDLQASPAAAWSAADELVIDAADALQLGEPWLRQAAAAGLQVTVVGGSAASPWLHLDGRSVLEPPAAGRRLPLIAPGLYGPLTAELPQQPPALRGRVALLAAALAVGGLIAAAALPRRRWPIMAAAAAAGLVLLLAWNRSNAAVGIHRGGIIVDGATPYRDQWLVLSARRDAHVSVELPAAPPAAGADTVLKVSGDLLLPVLRAPGDWQALNLHATPHSLRFDLRQGEQLLICIRSLLSQTRARPQPLQPSPLRAIAEALYLGPGARLAGEHPAAGATWPDLHIAPAP
jgi:hypothetical protein